MKIIIVSFFAACLCAIAQQLPTKCKVVILLTDAPPMNRVELSVADCEKDVRYPSGGVEVRNLLGPSLEVKGRVYFPRQRVLSVVVEPTVKWKISE